MDWGEETEEYEDKQPSNEKLHRSNVGSSNRINVIVPSSMAKAESISANTNKVISMQGNGRDKTPITLSVCFSARNSYRK